MSTNTKELKRIMRLVDSYAKLKAEPYCFNHTANLKESRSAVLETIKQILKSTDKFLC